MGYPDWWGERPRAKGHGSGRGKTLHQQMGGSGKGRGNSVKANMAQAVVGATTNILEDDVRQVALLELSPEQWSTILNVIRTHKAESSPRLTGKNPWIIDTSASRHMTGTLTCMTNIRDIEPCLVSMSNGTNMCNKRGNNHSWG